MGEFFDMFIAQLLKHYSMFYFKTADEMLLGLTLIATTLTNNKY